MKKTKVGHGRKLLLRGEIVARIAREDLQLVVGGELPSDAGTYPDTHCVSHPSFAAGK